MATTMKLEKLLTGLEKAELKVEKLETKIEKYRTQIEKNLLKLEKKGIEGARAVVEGSVLNEGVKGYMVAENKIHDIGRTLSLETQYTEWETLMKVKSAMETIYRTYNELALATKKRNENINKVSAEKATIEESALAPQVIIDFINRYGELVRKWLECYSSMDAVQIDKHVEEDKQYKLIALNAKVGAVVGEITNASNLQVSEKGDLTGYITGTKGKAEVQTFSAGGWNIQCHHYRTTVTKMEK